MSQLADVNIQSSAGIAGRFTFHDVLHLGLAKFDFLAEAEFGRIWEKWPNFGFAEAKAKIRCNPNYIVLASQLVLRLKNTLFQ